MLFLLTFFLAGCGGRQEESEVYFEIKTEVGQMPDLAENVDTSDMVDYVLLGCQFHQGERVQLWGEKKLEGGAIYLHREDGSRELLMEKVHGYFLSGFRWWIDGEGRCYLLDDTGYEIFRADKDKALWTDADFKTREGILFRCEADENETLKDICQLEDGRIIVLYFGERNTRLLEMDPNSGTLKEIRDVEEGPASVLIAAEGNDVLILSKKGLRKYGLKDGDIKDIIVFDGSSYILKENGDGLKPLVKQDFRLLEDGRAELLWSDGTLEYLQKQEVSQEREIVTLRVYISYSWLQEQIVKFNQKSEKYYVVVEEGGDGQWNDFRERTDMEIGAGRGADIICSDAVNDAYSLLEKGALEDLTPYMEEAGIQEEDYFPAAFSGWKYNEKVYGVNYTAKIESMCVDKELAGEEGISDIEDLVDKLLEYDSDAIYQKDLNALLVLKFLLKDSESLCGMVDFENGTCDFSGELFEKMLETAKRYGEDDRKRDWKCLTEFRPYYSFYCFNESEYLNENGKIVTGYLFDEGGYPEMKDNMLAINVNSDKKEGAWEFICFLLGEEVQLDFYSDESMPAIGRGIDKGSFPVSRSAFEKLCEEHLEVINGGIDNIRTDTYFNMETVITGLTEARKEELRTALEEARPMPLRTRPVLNLILEEAEGYFSGTKTIDQVRESLENRVRLFLNEKN